MENKKSNQIYRVIGCFILQLCMNWVYVMWVRSQSEILTSSWFVVVPMLGYFYFFFGLVAAAGLYHKKSAGLTLACGVLLFGVVCAVVSYDAAFKQDGVFELLIVPLIVLNAISVGYITYQSNFKESE